MTFYAGLMSLVGRYEVSNELKERREIQASMRAARAKAPRPEGTEILDYDKEEMTVIFLFFFLIFL